MKKYFHFFLLTRPYSYASEVARAILFILLIRANAQTSDLIWGVVLSLMMWIFFNWVSDTIQHDPGRMKVPPVLIFSPLLFTAIISYLLADYVGILGVLVYTGTILLYSLKSSNRYLGLIGPILRALTIIGFFIFICCLFKVIPNSFTVNIVLLVAVFKMIRNFLGDVRDIETDTWEFPARFGSKYSGVFIIGLNFLATLYILFFIHLEYKIILVLFCIFLFTSIMLSFYYLSVDNGKFWGYLTHYLMIIWFPIFELLIAINFRIEVEWILFILFLLFLIPLYSLNPGKNYPSLLEIRSIYKKNR